MARTLSTTVCLDKEEGRGVFVAGTSEKDLPEWATKYIGDHCYDSDEASPEKDEEAESKGAGSKTRSGGSKQ